MRFPNELRVGIMFLTGLILLVLVIVTLTRWGEGRNTYAFQIRFTEAQGIQKGAAVRVSGVTVGHVSDVTLDQDSHTALVTVRIDQSVSLHQNYQYVISMSGMVGERYIEITPVATNAGPVVIPGETVSGTSLPDLAEVMANANVLIGKMATATDSLNAIIGDEQSQEDIKVSLANIRLASATSVDFLRRLDQLTAANEENITQMIAHLQDAAADINTVTNVLGPQLTDSSMIQNFEAASAKVVTIAERVDRITCSLDELITDPQMTNDIKQSVFHLKQASIGLHTAMDNASKASGSLPAIATNLEEATGDLPGITGPFKDVSPEVAENVRQVTAHLRNASCDIGNVVATASSYSTTLKSLKVEPEGRLMYLVNGDDQRTRADLNVDILGRSTMLRLGAASIGNDTTANVQFGNRLNDQAWFRYGLIQSQFGVGVDYSPSTDWNVSGELFDPEHIRANILFDYRLKPIGRDWWFTSGVYDLFNGNTFGVGLTYQPGK